WRLGEARGPTASDATKNAHHGKYHGSPTFRQPGALRGDADTAIALDGKKSYVEVPDSKAFSVAASGRGLSVEVWLRPDALDFAGEGKEQYIHWLGKGEASRFEWGFRFYNRKSTDRPNRLSAYVWNPAGGLGAGAYFQDVLKKGEWIHIVACFDPGDRRDPKAGVRIYKNGVLRQGPPASGTLYITYKITPRHGTAPLRLGTRDLGSFLRGRLDQAATYPPLPRPPQAPAH